MSSLQIIGDNGTDFQRLNPGDTAIVPNNVQSAAGQTLTISSLMGALVIGATGLVLAMGTGGCDLSPGSGAFLTPSGAVTIGPGSVSLSGNTTVLAGKILATAGSGNINLPNNTSARFQIEGASVTSTVTATNLTTLTNGSNADLLHTHSSVSASALNVPGQTLWMTPVSGEGCYLTGSADNTWAKAKADVMTTARCTGVFQGTGGTLLVGGKIGLFLDAGLNAGLVPLSGQRIYVSAATAGRFTNVAPSSTGQVRAKVAMLLVAAGYDNTNGSQQTCIWQPDSPVQL